MRIRVYDLFPCVISCMFFVRHTTGNPEYNSDQDTAWGGWNPTIKNIFPQNVKVTSHRKMVCLALQIPYHTQHTHIYVYNPNFHMSTVNTPSFIPGAPSFHFRAPLPPLWRGEVGAVRETGYSMNRWYAPEEGCGGSRRQRPQ